MMINALMVDYDGTIAPLGVPRSESRVLARVESQLRRISILAPVCVVTAKDYGFVHGRTSFASGWACIGGLDVRTRNGGVARSRPRSMGKALGLARTVEARGVHLEMKRGPRGVILGISIDWSGNPEIAPMLLGKLATLRRTGFSVVHEMNSTYADVYATPPNKGEATKLLKSLLKIRGNVMFIGDSAMDNTAFQEASVSVGVTHGQPVEALRCKYIVDQSRLAEFLQSLADRGMDFSPRIPWIRRREA